MPDFLTPYAFMSACSLGDLVGNPSLLCGIGASLELGGKNPMIVLPDADLDRTVQGAIAACFPSTGQLCVSIERMYVADEIYDKFVPAFAAATKDLRIGAAYDFTMDVGCLTLFDHETFGPVVAIYRYSDLDDVIERANATTYGLNGSVWGRNGANARAVAARIHTGTVNVNEAFTAAWGSIDAPMGGMGDSGLGRRHGADGILKYTEAQTVAHQRLQGFQAPKGVDPQSWAGFLTGALKVFKKAGMR